MSLRYFALVVERKFSREDSSGIDGPGVFPSFKTVESRRRALGFTADMAVESSFRAIT
jgi:hypothetical protein